jgi:hypothetical protein
MRSENEIRAAVERLRSVSEGRTKINLEVGGPDRELADDEQFERGAMLEALNWVLVDGVFEADDDCENALHRTLRKFAPQLECYISAAAVKQFMVIMGYQGSADGPVFDRAAIELEQACEQARLARDADEKSRYQQWRVKWTVRGKRSRLELIVSTEPRPEGPLPQLIAVRNKGA